MASKDQNQVCDPTEQDEGRLCRFSELEAKHSYPPRFERCKGGLVKIQDCNDDIDPNFGERYIILTRSGYINRFKGFEKWWYICENHRNIFGKGFERDFVLKQKVCKYPEHESGQLSRHVVSMDQSRALLDKNGWIVPYGSKVCIKCDFKIKEFHKAYLIEKEKEQEKGSQEVPMDSEELIESSQSEQLSDSSQQYHLSPPESSESLTGSQPQDQVPEANVGSSEALLSLIQTVEPGFTSKKCMWKTKKPLKELSKRSKRQMKKTFGLAIKAAINAMSGNIKDHGELLKFLKESGCMEKEIGNDTVQDAYLREVVKAYNMAETPEHRLQILTVVAKVPY